MKYRPDIDGIRAIAVLLVLVFHFDLFALGEGGFVGVDLFFVLSGYLISSIIWRDLEKSRFTLKHFYVRRVRRLAPALIATQVAVLLVAAVALLPLEVLSLAKESFFVQTYLSNVYYWQTLDYFGMHATRSFLLHTWSLAVEEQFYLFFPIVLLLVHRWIPRHRALTLVVLCLGSFALNLAFVGPKPQATFYLLPTRAWEMGLGALVPFLEPYALRSRAVRAVAGPLGLVLIGAALVLHGPGTPFPGWFALLPTLAAMLLLLAGVGEGSPLSRLLGLRLPVWIGEISYPLYLVHWPIHIYAIALFPTYGPLQRWAMFGLSFVLAWVIYRWVEKPVRTGTFFDVDRRLVVTYAGALALVLAVVGSAIATGGWRGRFSAESLAIADVADDYDRAARKMAVYPGDAVVDRLHVIGAPGAPVRWLVFGDSHAGALTGAFSQWLVARGEGGVVAYLASCMPVLDAGDGPCRRFNREVHAWLAEHREVTGVVMVSIWRQAIEPGYRDRDGVVVAGDAALRAFESSLAATLAAFTERGVRVHVWEPLPISPNSVPEALARRAIWGIDLPVSQPLAAHQQTFAFLTRALDGHAAQLAGRIRPQDALCKDGVCAPVEDGRPLFLDNNHPAFGESGWFARIIEAQVPR